MQMFFGEETERLFAALQFIGVGWSEGTAEPLLADNWIDRSFPVADSFPGTPSRGMTGE